MFSRHLSPGRIHPLGSGACFARCLARRAPHRRSFSPLNAVQDQVKEKPAKEAKKHAGPDMNAAVTSAREADKEEGHTKKSKKRKVSSKQQMRRKEKKAAQKEKIVQSGPASSLDSSKARKRRKKPVTPAAKMAQTIEPAKKNTVDKQQTGSLKQKDGVSLTDLNPYDLGKRSRAVLESVWKRFSNLGSPGRSTYPTYPREAIDTIGSSSGGSVDFETPQAAFTNVLVIGATGQVGRILVRKLLLRGYTVTALVRADSPGLKLIPKAVRVVKGDLGEYKDLRAAMEGVDKIVYCASSRTAITADVKRVSQFGIQMAAKALQDERLRGITSMPSGVQPFPSARIKLAGGHERDKHSKDPPARWEPWEVLHVGPSRESLARMEARSRKYGPTNLDKVELWINKRNNLVFQGMLINRSAYAATGINLDMERQNLRGTVGLVIRVKGDGLTYAATLTTDKGDSYIARFSTNATFQNVRIPYSAFRKNEGSSEEAPQRIIPEDIRKVGVMAEYRSRPSRMASSRDLDSLTADRSDRQFKLEINRIHALPAGTETDFILVSCAGVVTPGVTDLQQDSVTTTKRQGEACLRTSGLAYTVVRPGPIINEPGGYKALVFDQGNRISQSISRADVADVCLKALHDTAARNKTFEVCHEYATASEIEKYELVAHLPDKANSYLTPALQNLEAET